MKVLPYTPVEVLAVAPRNTAPHNDNGGIVPPWLRATADAQRAAGGNTGVVPPWLQRVTQVRPTYPMQPLNPAFGPDVPHTMGVAQPTLYDPTPVEEFGPDVPHIM